MIVATIERHWARPPGSPEYFRVIVHLEVLPTGQVVSTNIKETSGNAALDRSWLDAVARANPLPAAPEPGAYHRTMNITFAHHPGK
jgi:colicin import membrane protein